MKLSGGQQLILGRLLSEGGMLYGPTAGDGLGFADIECFTPLDIDVLAQGARGEDLSVDDWREMDRLIEVYERRPSERLLKELAL